MISSRAGVLKETAKKIPNQETGLGNRGPLEALNDKKMGLLISCGHVVRDFESEAKTT